MLTEIKSKKGAKIAAKKKSSDVKQYIKKNNPNEWGAIIDLELKNNNKNYLKHIMFQSAKLNYEPIIIKILDSNKPYLHELFIIGGRLTGKTTLMFMIENKLLNCLKKILNDKEIENLKSHMYINDKQNNNICHYIAKITDADIFTILCELINICGSTYLNAHNKQKETPIQIALNYKNYLFISHILNSTNNISHDNYLKIINSDYFTNNLDKLNIDLYKKNVGHITPEIEYKLLCLIYNNNDNNDNKLFSLLTGAVPKKNIKYIIKYCLENRNYLLLEAIRPILKITPKKLLRTVNTLSIDSDTIEKFNEYVFEKLNPVCKIEI
jgi:hypothetical protein